MKANFVPGLISEGGPSQISTPSSTQNESKANQPKPESKAATPPSLDDDSGSELEPDTLVPKYLELQTRLYNLSPDVFDRPKKGKKSGRENAEGGPTDPQVANIQRKVSKIENDVLFDREDAGQNWRAKLDDLRKEAAFFLHSKREEEKPTEEQEQPEEANPEPDPESDALLGNAENAELLGDMFEAEEPALETGVILDELSKASMHVHDFGRTTGLSPRRILEETCKSRYECQCRCACQ